MKVWWPNRRNNQKAGVWRLLFNYKESFNWLVVQLENGGLTTPKTYYCNGTVVLDSSEYISNILQIDSWHSYVFTFLSVVAFHYNIQGGNINVC